MRRSCSLDHQSTTAPALAARPPKAERHTALLTTDDIAVLSASCSASEGESRVQFHEFIIEGARVKL